MEQTGTLPLGSLQSSGKRLIYNKYSVSGGTQCSEGKSRVRKTRSDQVQDGGVLGE